MGEAIGDILPFGVGVALSPLPIVAVILMLVTERARVNGPLFVVGWLIGLAAVGTIVLVVAGPAGASDDGQPSTGASVVQLGLGLALLGVALRQYRGRPRGDDDPALPKWIGAIEGFTSVKDVIAGAVLVAANPKNLVLVVGAATSIAQLDLPASEQAIAYTVFAVIGSVGVATPVVIYFALGERAVDVLDRLKAWMARNNAVIMAVLCLVIGAKLIGAGISGLS